MKLTINNITKTYPNGTRALDGVELEIEPGMFGLLGPNGAGKSSLMRTIATLQDADEGEIMLGDLNVGKQKEEIRKVLGYLPQTFGLYPKVSAVNMLDHLALLKGISDKKERKDLVNTLLEQVNLTAHKHKNLGGYSGGMRQRFGIAQALIGQPRLIIVDEPTAGLDPAERVRFLNLLSEIGQNIVIILSTHIVEDVSELCSNMAIIDKGRVLKTGQPIELIKDLKNRVWEKMIEREEVNDYQEKFNVIYTRLSLGKVLIHVEHPHAPDNTFKMVEPDLRDVYFSTLKVARNQALATKATVEA